MYRYLEGEDASAQLVSERAKPQIYISIIERIEKQNDPASALFSTLCACLLDACLSFCG
jgi:hypothetical protein